MGFVQLILFFLLSLSSTELLHGMFMIPANTPQKVLLTSDEHGSSYLFELRNKRVFVWQRQTGQKCSANWSRMKWQCFLSGAKRANSIQNICNVLEFLQHQLSRYEKDHASQICASLFCGIWHDIKHRVFLSFKDAFFWEFCVPVYVRVFDRSFPFSFLVYPIGMEVGLRKVWAVG